MPGLEMNHEREEITLDRPNTIMVAANREKTAKKARLIKYLPMYSPQYSSQVNGTTFNKCFNKLSPTLNEGWGTNHKHSYMR